MEEVVRQVLAAYPRVLRSADVRSLGNQGGFSGAGVWRLTTPAGEFCLRGGALAETREHLRQRHALMARARAAGLLFVPAVLSASDANTVVEAVGRCWEVMDWQPGRADFHASPSRSRLQAAVAALARLHLAWQGLTAIVGVCPAVERRLELAQRFQGGLFPAVAAGPLLDALLVRTRHTLTRLLPEIPRLLNAWKGFVCPLQPCLRDVWHDHLLFEGDALTGLVDYAAVGMDSVATDLARMLGSLIEDEDEAWGIALEAYRGRRPLSRDEERLARVLDRTGVIAALGGWLHKLSGARQGVADVAVVARRMEGLLRRGEVVTLS